MTKVHAYVYNVPVLYTYVLCFIGLMGLLEKRRFRNFMLWTDDFNKDEPATFKGNIMIPYSGLFPGVKTFV